MNIRKKIKVVDAVFFTDEIDYLLFRFTELNDYVDLFIILEPLVDYNGSPRISVFEKYEYKFEFWKEKIIHIKSETPSDKEMEENFYYRKLEKSNIIKDSKDKFNIKQLHDLKVKLTSFGLSFDDIIMISNIDEFPIIPPIDILQTHLSFNPLIFSQKDFIWSKDFCKLENHLGTLCFSYSHLITSDLMFTLNLSKNHNDNLNITPIIFGYRFSYFNSIEESVIKISKKYAQDNLESIEELINYSRNNLLYYDLPLKSNPKPLKKYLGELPLNIDMLNSQPIGRDIPKKHLVVIGIDSYRDIETKDFESISIITHAKSISTKEHKQVHDNIKIHYIQIPNQKYYDIFVNDNTLENFQKMFFLNEIKKIIILQHPLDIDIFEFYFEGKTISYPWSIIKDTFIYDLLHN